MPSPFPCSPVIREWLWKKTQIEKNIYLSVDGADKFSGYSPNIYLFKVKETLEKGVKYVQI